MPWCQSRPVWLALSLWLTSLWLRPVANLSILEARLESRTSDWIRSPDLVKLGDNLTLSCGVDSPWFFCLWSSPSGEDRQCAIQESEPLSVCRDQAGLTLTGSKTACQLHLSRADLIHHGDWLCLFNDIRDFKTVRAQVRLEVARPAHLSWQLPSKPVNDDNNKDDIDDGGEDEIFEDLPRTQRRKSRSKSSTMFGMGYEQTDYYLDSAQFVGDGGELPIVDEDDGAANYPPSTLDGDEEADPGLPTLILTEGDRVNVTCKATGGYPAPRLEWNFPIVTDASANRTRDIDKPENIDPDDDSSDVPRIVSRSEIVGDATAKDPTITVIETVEYIARLKHSGGRIGCRSNQQEVSSTDLAASIEDDYTLDSRVEEEAFNQRRRRDALRPDESTLYSSYIELKLEVHPIVLLRQSNVTVESIGIITAVILAILLIIILFSLLMVVMVRRDHRAKRHQKIYLLAPGGGAGANEETGGTLQAASPPRGAAGDRRSPSVSGATKGRRWPILLFWRRNKDEEEMEINDDLNEEEFGEDGLKKPIWRPIIKRKPVRKGGQLVGPEDSVHHQLIEKQMIYGMGQGVDSKEGPIMLQSSPGRRLRMTESRIAASQQRSPTSIGSVSPQERLCQQQTEQLERLLNNDTTASVHQRPLHLTREEKEDARRSSRASKGSSAGQPSPFRDGKGAAHVQSPTKQRLSREQSSEAGGHHPMLMVSSPLGSSRAVVAGHSSEVNSLNNPANLDHCPACCGCYCCCSQAELTSDRQLGRGQSDGVLIGRRLPHDDEAAHHHPTTTAVSDDLTYVQYSPPLPHHQLHAHHHPHHHHLGQLGDEDHHHHHHHHHPHTVCPHQHQQLAGGEEGVHECDHQAVINAGHHHHHHHNHPHHQDHHSPHRLNTVMEMQARSQSSSSSPKRSPSCSSSSGRSSLSYQHPIVGLAGDISVDGIVDHKPEGRNKHRHRKASSEEGGFSSSCGDNSSAKSCCCPENEDQMLDDNDAAATTKTLDLPPPASATPGGQQHRSDCPQHDPQRRRRRHGSHAVMGGGSSSGAPSESDDKHPTANDHLNATIDSGYHTTVSHSCSFHTGGGTRHPCDEDEYEDECGDNNQRCVDAAALAALDERLMMPPHHLRSSPRSNDTTTSLSMKNDDHLNYLSSPSRGPDDIAADTSRLDNDNIGTNGPDNINGDQAQAEALPRRHDFAAEAERMRQSSPLTSAPAMDGSVVPTIVGGSDRERLDRVGAVNFVGPTIFDCELGCFIPVEEYNRRIESVEKPAPRWYQE